MINPSQAPVSDIIEHNYHFVALVVIRVLEYKPITTDRRSSGHPLETGIRVVTTKRLPDEVYCPPLGDVVGIGREDPPKRAIARCIVSATSNWQLLGILLAKITAGSAKILDRDYYIATLWQ